MIPIMMIGIVVTYASRILNGFLYILFYDALIS